MNKDNMIDAIDEITIENQIHLDLPTSKMDNQKDAVSADDYQSMLKDLILMALPSPSQHVH